MNSRALLIRICILVAACSVPASGQAVIGFSPGSTAFGSAPTTEEPKSAQVAPLSSIMSAVAKQAPLAQWGPLAVRPHISYALEYGNGILRVPGEPENTTMQSFSPGVLLELGNRVSLDYTLTHHTYSNHLLVDTTDHNAAIQGNITMGDWRFSASQSYGSNSPTLVETGGQTAERTNTSTVSIAYEVGPRTLIETTLRRHSRSASPLVSTPAWTGSNWIQWSESTWLRYSISKQLSLGIGFQAGYDEIRDNPDMSYTQPELEARWQPIERFSLTAQVGLERRKPDATDARIQENLTYSASARYQVFKTTGLSIRANRNVSASYFADQTTETEGWVASIDQRLLSRFYLMMSRSSGRTTYLPIVNQPYVERDDRFYSYTFNLSTPVLRRGTVGIFYSRNRNRSNNQGFGFTTNQMGATFAYRF